MQRALGQEAGAVGDALLVEGDAGMMEEVAVILFCLGAEEIELPGDGAGIEGEVLADEIGQAFGEVAAEDLFVDGGEAAMEAFIVQQAGIVSAEVEVDSTAELRLEGAEKGIEAGDDIIVVGDADGSEGALQKQLRGNDVEAGVGLGRDIGNSEHGGWGIGLGAYQRMGGGDEAGGNGHGIDDLFHQTGMPALAVDADGEIADVGEGFSIPVGEDADGQQRVDMQAQHGDGAVEPAALHDQLPPRLAGYRTAHGAFLGRLEDEFNSTPEGSFTEQMGRPKEHGRMDVMAAGMHDPFGSGGEGDAGFLPDGKRVHVGAENDGRPLPFRQGADDTGEGNTLRRDRQLGQALADEFGGFELGEAQLRVLMQVPTDGDELIE